MFIPVFMRLYKNFQFLRNINYNKKKWKRKKIININKKSKINLINFKLYVTIKKFFGLKKHKSGLNIINSFSENFFIINNSRKINYNNYQNVTHTKIHKGLKFIRKNSSLLNKVIINSDYAKPNKINVCKFNYFFVKKITKSRKKSNIVIFTINKSNYQFSKLIWRNFNNFYLKKMLKKSKYIPKRIYVKKIFNYRLKANNIGISSNYLYTFILYSFLNNLVLKNKCSFKRINIVNSTYTLFKNDFFNISFFYKPQNLFILTKKQKTLKNLQSKSKHVLKKKYNKVLRLFSDKHWIKYLLYKNK